MKLEKCLHCGSTDIEQISSNAYSIVMKKNTEDGEIKCKSCNWVFKIVGIDATGLDLEKGASFHK